MEIPDQGLLDYLASFITENKKSAIEKALEERTRFYTVVLEDIFKPHNASAVLRTCDCFGIQDVHVIEKANQYKINRYVTRGASQWIDLHKYYSRESSAVLDCFAKLKTEGYKIYGTSPVPDSMTIHELDPNQKIALVFGNELEGISEEVTKNVDGLVHIPMMGFTESFNISVSASIFLYDLRKRAKEAGVSNFFLSEAEKQELRIRWYRDVIRRSDLIEKAYYELKQP
jgi:tRNA (guanosine-2'-O-)-methyltransferase